MGGVVGTALFGFTSGAGSANASSAGKGGGRARRADPRTHGLTGTFPTVNGRVAFWVGFTGLRAAVT